MEIKNFFESKTFKIITWTVAGLLFVSFVFKAGMIVGGMKAGFMRGWGENYQRNFGGPKGGFQMMMNDSEFLQPGGVVGKIISIDGSKIIVEGPDAEKNVIINEKTSIRKQREDIKLEDLKTDDFVVVFGEPNDGGQIEARLIRVLPEPDKMPEPLSSMKEFMPMRRGK